MIEKPHMNRVTTLGSLLWTTDSEEVYFPIPVLVWATQGSSDWRSTVDKLEPCSQVACVQISTASLLLAYVTS